jgi:hypothetical protein
MTITHKVDTYAGLLQQIRNDLRLQHPEWIQPNGQSPMCDFYEARLIESLSIQGQSKEMMAAVSGIPILPDPKNSSVPIFS